MPAPDTWVVNPPKGTVVANETVFLFKSRWYKPDASKMLFVYCAGKSAGAGNIVGSGFCYESARRGYPVICGDYGDTPTQVGKVDGAGIWGNDAAVAKVMTHVAWAQDATKLGAKTGKFGLLYGSHGMALAYAVAAAYPTQVQLIAGAIGTADVEDIRANNRNGYQASIEAAYTNNAGWQAARATHNPVEVAASLSIPQLDYYSTDDPICVASTHAALAAAAGSNMTQRSLGAVGHSFIGVGPPGGTVATDKVAAFADWCEAVAA